MSPLIQYVGNSSPQDATSQIELANNPDTGAARSVSIGGRALVSGDEFRAIAANYQVEFIENSPQENEKTKSNFIPTEMPEGYDENGYQEDESPSVAVFTAEAYPDDENEDLITPDGVNSSNEAGSGDQVIADVRSSSSDSNPDDAASESSAVAGQAGTPAPVTPAAPAAPAGPVTPVATPSPSTTSSAAPASGSGSAGDSSTTSSAASGATS